LHEHFKVQDRKQYKRRRGEGKRKDNDAKGVLIDLGMGEKGWDVEIERNSIFKGG